MATQSEILELVFKAIDDVNDQLPADGQLEKTEGCTIVGEGAHLDSLGLLNLILAVETLVNDRHTPPISLAEQLLAAEDAKPPETLGALAAFIVSLQEPAG